MNDAAPAPVTAEDDCTPGAIALTAISKWFDTGEGEPLTVLQNIDLAVPAHSILAILGASGCGKSTLLNIISGILTPDRGNVCFAGVRARDFKDWRRISYMFQEDRLLPWRTAIANVEFALEAGAMPKAERQRRALVVVTTRLSRMMRLRSSVSRSSKTLFRINSRAACARAWHSPAASSPSRPFC